MAKCEHGRRTGRRPGAALVVLGVTLAVLLAGTLAPAAASHAFPDVPDTSAFHDDIAWAVDAGITIGYPDGTFRPTAPVSRQAAAAFLHRWWLALGRPDPDALPDPGFADVPPTHPFHDDIAWAASVGLTTGYPDGTFRPTTPVSRQAMSAYLHRLSHAVELPDPDPLPDPGFGDVAPGHPFYDDIAWAAAVGITDGFPDGDFHSTDPLSRQAAAAVLHRLWDHVPLLVVDDGGDATDAAPGDGTCDDGTGACTLRAAVQEANATPGHARITFDGATTLVELTLEAPKVSSTYVDDDVAALGDLDLTDHLTIDGAGVTVDASALTARVEGCNTFQICALAPTDGTFDVPGAAADPTVTLRGLRVTGGYTTAPTAAALRARAGIVTAEELIFQGNLGTVVHQTAGTLTLERSSVVGNAGWVDQTGGHLRVEQSTIGAPAGERINIFCFRFTCFEPPPEAPSTHLRSQGGTLDVVGSTVDVLSTSGTSATTTTGSLIDRCLGTIASGGHNATRAGCLAAPGPGDLTAPAGILVQDPADNGGPTPTRLPWANSPGIDAIPAGTPGLCDGTLPADQRGEPRPDGAACDMGAVEGHDGTHGMRTFLVDSPSDTSDAAPGDGTCADGTGACTLRAAVDETNALPGADVVHLAEGVWPVLARPGADEDGNATGDLDVTDPLTIDGRDLTRSSTTATLDAEQLDRALHATADLTVRDLYLRGGAGVDEGGAIAIDGAVLTLSGTTFNGNEATRGGGVHIGPSASATIDRSTFTGNRAVATGGDDALGGAIAQSGGQVVITASNLEGNRATADAGDAHGGAISQAGGLLTIDRSSLFNNEATSTTGAATGGGLVSDGAGVTTTVTRSSLGANAVGGATADGGAIAAGNATLSVTASTIGHNTATRGRGLWVGASASVRLDASLLDHDGAASCDGDGAPLALPGDHNLVGDASCGFTGIGNPQGVDPALGTFSLDFPTGTNVATPGVAAVDAIAPGAAGLCDGTYPVDQRGAARPQGAGCDVGAVEITPP